MFLQLLHDSFLIIFILSVLGELPVLGDVTMVLHFFQMLMVFSVTWYIEYYGNYFVTISFSVLFHTENLEMVCILVEGHGFR